MSLVTVKLEPAQKPAARNPGHGLSPCLLLASSPPTAALRDRDLREINNKEEFDR